MKRRVRCGNNRKSEKGWKKIRTGHNNKKSEKQRDGGRTGEETGKMRK